MTAKEIERLLLERIAELIYLRPDDLDPTVAHATYGLDSASALVLATELEEVLGVPVESSLLWDHDTIRALALHLAKRFERRSEELDRPSTRGGR